jgi:hypothetical protein
MTERRIPPRTKSLECFEGYDFLIIVSAFVRADQGREGPVQHRQGWQENRHRRIHGRNARVALRDRWPSDHGRFGDRQLDEKLIPVSYEVSNPEGKIRVNVQAPISEVQTVVGGQTSSADFRFPEGGVILDNNFFHHYLVLLYRAQSGQNNFGVFVPQDMSVGSAQIRSTGARTYDLEIGDVRMQATTDAEGSLIKLTVPSANVVVER